MPIEPDDAEVIQEAVLSFLLDVHVMVPAVTKSYDAAKQRGEFQPVINGSVKDSDGNNVFEGRPSILNVPVQWEGGGGYYSHKPLAKGDTGILIFSEDAYAHWRATGEVSDPGDVTRHSIAYPVFLPGLRSDLKPFADAPAAGEAVEIVPAGGHLRVSKAGGAAQFVALSNKVDAALTALNGILATLATTLAGAAVEPACATAGAALTTALGSWPAPTGTACTSLKAD